MNTMNGRLIPPARRQRGAALLTGLIFMVIMTLLGITAARMAGLEERMSGNMLDRARAMQAAELALREAEKFLLAGGAGSGVTKFTPACASGLCYNGTAGYAVPVWTTVNMTNAAPSVAATASNGVSASPRYIIEGMQKYCWRKCESSLTTGYRVTVRAVGMNPNTVVWLQEVFKP